MVEQHLTHLAENRPIYHIVCSSEHSSPHDPNAAVFWNGRYHLHYIVSDGDLADEGGISYAHLSSPDMIHWKEHLLTLTHQKMGKWLASGTCIISKEGVPTIIYHGCDPSYCKHEEGIGHNYLGMATDADLEDWKVHPFIVEPKLSPDQDGSVIAYWDPDIWLEGETYYALFGVHPDAISRGKKPTLMKSIDLQNWSYVGEFLAKDMPDVASDEDLSCPNFFKLGDQHMLLCISHNRGCRYYLGEWKQEKFVPAFHARMTWCDNKYFAPESLQTPDGRRVMWAWVFGKGNQWNNILSLPRELYLENGMLRIKPLRELNMLRKQQMQESNIIVEDGKDYPLKLISGDNLELVIPFQSNHANRFGVKVFCDQNNSTYNLIYAEPSKKRIIVADEIAPFEFLPDEELVFHIFLDKSVIEVFINDRQAVTRVVDQPAGKGIYLFSEGDNLTISKIIGWKLEL